MSSDALVAVIIDIVDSRSLADRDEAQGEIERAFAALPGVVPLDPLRATVGDEFQVIYATLTDALIATTSAVLSLPAGLELRFGFGRGEVRAVESSTGVPVQDGPGWWSAREAIQEAHRREDGRSAFLRSWYVSADDRGGAEERLANAYFLSRDHIVARMNARARRVALGLLRGETQSQIAAVEGVTPSAISQSVQKSGATAIVEGLRALGSGGR